MLFSLQYHAFQPEGSNSQVVGNTEDHLAEDTMDSISSILRKEIEGKITISNPKVSASLAEGKDSIGESFVDANEDLLSATSHGSPTKSL